MITRWQVFGDNDNLRASDPQGEWVTFEDYVAANATLVEAIRLFLEDIASESPEAKWRDDPDGDDDPLLSHRRLIALADALARAETQP